MGVIRTDPSQTKTVVALVGVLVVALGVTIVRLKPASTPQAASSQQAVATVAQAPSGKAKDEPILNRTRNPFAMKSGINNSSRPFGSDISQMPRVENSQIELKMARDNGSAQIEPLAIDPMMSFNASSKQDSHIKKRTDSNQNALPLTNGIGSWTIKQQNAVQGQSDTAKVPPAFALLATIKNDKGYTAVIREGTSTPRIIEVGDVLAAGYRVAKLAEDRAILTNGKEVIIAKRTPI